MTVVEVVRQLDPPIRPYARKIIRHILTGSPMPEPWGISHHWAAVARLKIWEAITRTIDEDRQDILHNCNVLFLGSKKVT